MVATAFWNAYDNIAYKEFLALQGSTMNAH
jgi:hypothetical protein